MTDHSHCDSGRANITTRFLFERFLRVQTLVIVHPDGRREKRTLGLESWQRKAMEALGTKDDAFKPVMPMAR